MKDFEGLKVPGIDERPEGGKYRKQDYECKQVSDHSDCHNMIECGECIFYMTNINKFEKWDSQKAL